MRMNRYITYLLGVLLLTISCDRSFTMSGRVVNDATNTPVEGVRIITSENTTTHSDSSGHFKVNRFGSGSKSDKLEVLLSKEGYKTKYFDLSKLKDIQEISLSMKASNDTLNVRYSQTYVKLLYWINMIFVNFFVLLTFLFVLFGKMRYKWIWITLFLFTNFTLNINYINGAPSFSFLHLPFYLKHYVYYPFTIKIVFPFSIILFWILHFIRTTSTINKRKAG